MTKSSPHVVIIMADQLRADVLGQHYTPHINRLADESAVFTRAYCTSPLCIPARGSFFTGRYPNETGSIINPWEKQDFQHGLVRSATPNLYQLLEDDFDSWHTGKQHFYTEDRIDRSPNAKTHWCTLEGSYHQYLRETGKSKPGGPAYRAPIPEMALGKVTRRRMYSIPTVGRYEDGFDGFFDGYITRQTLQAIRQRDRKKPLLLNAMYLAPHPPFQIPEPWFSKYSQAELPANVGRWSKNQSPLQLYNLPGFLGSRYCREDWERIWPVYLGLVNLLDHCVGLVISELKQQGIFDDSLIIFTSDHGEMLGSHCLWQKMCMYEEAVRIPLYMKFPKSAGIAPCRIDDLVSAVDILPTLCDFLKRPIPDGVSGRSLLPLLSREDLGRGEVFIQFDGNGARGNFQRCVIRDSLKLIVDLFKDELFLELYDVEQDPEEQVNLAFESCYCSAVEEMLQSLCRHMDKTGDLLEIPDNAYSRFIKEHSPFAQE